MSTSGESNVKYQRAYVPTTALAKSLEFDEHAMHVVFTDGRVLSVPLEWFPLLRVASPEQLKHYEIDGGGVSLHWPDLDEDLSVASLMAGIAGMDNNRLDAWVRHFDSLLWTVTSILLAANGALLVYSYSSDNRKFVSGLAVGGLILTGLTVYFAASMRELRHRFQERLDDELKALIQQGRRLYQWWAFIALFLLLIVGWTWLLCARAPAWRFLWFDLGGIVAIATLLLAYFSARSAKKTRADGRTVIGANTPDATNKGESSQ